MWEVREGFLLGESRSEQRWGEGLGRGIASMWEMGIGEYKGGWVWLQYSEGRDWQEVILET